MTQDIFFLPYNKNLVEKARDLRKNLTLAEKTIWVNYLRSFKYRVFKQRPINNFIVDFYCPSLKLVIEIDGDTHFTESGITYDRNRKKILESYGLKVIRFTNDEVLKDLQGVCCKIEEMIPPTLLDKKS